MQLKQTAPAAGIRKLLAAERRKLLRIMKLTALILLTACLATSAKTRAQTITLNEKNASLETVLKQIQKQAGYQCIYTVDVIQKAKPVSISVKNATIEQVLSICFKDQPLDYSIIEKLVVIKEKVKSPNVGDEQSVISTPPPIDIKGRIVNEKGEPVVASVQVKGTSKGVTTNDNGEFEIKGVDDNAILVITGVSIESFEVKLNGRSELVLNARIKNTTLDETIVQAYGVTTRRLKTGNIAKVTGEEISRQPVFNPLAALEGRVTGMVVTQNSGLPGSPFKVEIRGRTSLPASLGLTVSNDPLFIVDGVPFAPNNNQINTLTSALGQQINGGGLSPFGLINPSEIESIEVLKDADATAIYGSRGANGVVLITTKKGKAGKTNFSVNAYYGISRVTRTMELLKTQDFLKVRRETLDNDAVTPTATTAPDLLVFDTTRYTDFKKEFIGNNAKTANIEAAVSGGNSNTQFFLGMGYRHETTVYPADYFNRTGSLHFNLNHTSTNRKFAATFNTSLASNYNTLPETDITSSINLSPDYPSLIDSTGNLIWQYKGIQLANPYGFLKQSYTARTNNLINSLQLSYKILSSLSLIVNGGFNLMTGDEMKTIPKGSQNPSTNPSARLELANNTFKSWILGSNLDYRREFKGSKLNIIGGYEWQKLYSSGLKLTGTGFANDALIQNISAASTISNGGNSVSEYKYLGIFGRINYNFKNKYLVNISGRRDGSSKFGPEKQFGNFGAIGLGWIFSNEGFLEKNGLLSFGKIRASYGTTGNDKIPNYLYLPAWSSTLNPYQGQAGLTPSNLYNPNYSWEINRKLEGSIDLGFFKDRLLLTTTYYRNRSSNQLIFYPLPFQTGFNVVVENFDALVQNKGWEVELISKNIDGKKFNWRTSFLLTIPQNKLLSFPGLSTSSFSSLLQIGKPLSVYRGFKYAGVDPQTGVFTFFDVNGQLTSSPNPSTDQVILGHLDPKYYGSIGNTFSIAGFEIDVFFEFRKQIGANYLNSLPAVGIGRALSNLPVTILDRWQKPGDIAMFERYAWTSGTTAYKAAQTFFSSSYFNSARFGDASFIRMRNASVSYTVRHFLDRQIGLDNLRIYVIGQNLLTITKYKGSDPETQGLYRMPPLRTIAGGIQITF